MRLVLRAHLLLVLAACPTSGSPIGNYCARLQDVSGTYAALCPDLFPEMTGGAICPETIEASCTELELESLEQELDCMELVTACDDLVAYEACLSAVIKPSQTCVDAVETLFL
jgi:hypothetical protein